MGSAVSLCPVTDFPAMPTRITALAVWCTCSLATLGRADVPYNPYADNEALSAPVAPDGTIRWGTFYKSATMQKTYERLWELGACRNTKKAITIPVQENKLIIDRLPQADFSGVVHSAAGPLAGGMVSFIDRGADPTHATPLVAQLHPAGVSQVRVVGRVPAHVVGTGMTVRIRATVDERGRIHEPVRAIDIVTPPADFVPDEVRPGHLDEIVGTVQQRRHDIVTLRLPTGKIRRLTLTLADDAEATVDAARLDLVAPGDIIEARGRLWSGNTIPASAGQRAKRLRPG
ncbi:MAG: hypothetical protein EBR23_00060, partial [Planctomycetia bacterium]|nr:hypothetical protein [Planctomycetia bacterium]